MKNSRIILLQDQCMSHEKNEKKIQFSCHGRLCMCDSFNSSNYKLITVKLYE